MADSTVEGDWALASPQTVPLRWPNRLILRRSFIESSFSERDSAAPARPRGLRAAPRQLSIANESITQLR